MAVAASAVSTLTSCAPREPLPAFKSLDLLVRGKWTLEEAEASAPDASVEPTEAFCGDETFLGLAVEPGQAIATSLGPSGDAALHLSGCFAVPEDSVSAGPPGPSARLEITVEAEGREVTRVAVPFAAGFWQKEVDLTTLDAGEGALRVRANLDHGTVWLRQIRQVVEPPWKPRRKELSAAASTESGGRRPQVLFISVDTLREDAVSALGGLGPADETVATPDLDRFVEESQLFLPHYAAAGWTRPSHGTLLTGLSPLACGALGAEGALRPGLRTLAERFRDAGFRTAALVYDIAWFHPRFDFDRGFESYRTERWRLERAVPEVASWISDHRDEPFLFFFHTFEPHSDARWLPYESAGTTRNTVWERFGVPGYGCREGHCASHLLEALDQGRLAPLPREREILRFLYARSAAYVDRELGQLFALLRRLGIYEDLLIVLTSDHGEVLLDHGQFLHGKPWEEVIRVPLAVKWPDGELAGTRVTTPTGAVDLVPTLLEAAGLDASGLPGTSLRRRRRAVPVFVGHNFRAVIHQGLKAVFREPEPPMLFDLRTDPREARNLAEERPEDLERLRRLIEAQQELDRKLARRFDRSTRGENPGLTTEEKRRLRALGYLGSD